MRSARRLPAALTMPEPVTCYQAGDLLVHRAGRDDVVADQPPLGAGAVDAPLGEDRLARDAVADVARQAQVGRARDDAFLARRQRHVGVLGGDHLVHGQQDLAVAADGEAFDRGDPQLFDPCLPSSGGASGSARPR